MPIFFTKKSCNRGVEPPPQMPLTVKRLIRNHSTQFQCTKIGFLEFLGPNQLFLLIFDQFKVLETNKDI